jgi:hypothetical protein
MVGCPPTASWPIIPCASGPLPHDCPGGALPPLSLAPSLRTPPRRSTSSLWSWSSAWCSSQASSGCSAPTSSRAARRRRRERLRLEAARGPCSSLLVWRGAALPCGGLRAGGGSGVLCHTIKCFERRVAPRPMGVWQARIRNGFRGAAAAPRRAADVLAPPLLSCLACSAWLRHACVLLSMLSTCRLRWRPPIAPSRLQLAPSRERH